MRVPFRLALVVLLLLLARGLVFGRQGTARGDADRMSRKIDLIIEHGLVPRRTALRTPVSESEINAYLDVYARDQLPTGVVRPRLSILGDDRVAGIATIDLDAVRKDGSGGWFDPTSYLAGRLPVNAKGVLRTSNGVARFYLESAEVSGVPVPKALLQQILSHYTRTPDLPQGIDLDESFAMPAGIRQIEIRRGEAVVVQQ